MQTLRVGTHACPAAAGKDELAKAVGDPPGGAPAFAPPAVSQTALALLDIVQGARAPYLWGLLGRQDIRGGYRRSKLGPFWLTISQHGRAGGSYLCVRSMT